MTWEELKEKAKEIGYRIDITEFDNRQNLEYLENPDNDFIFYQDGTIQIEADLDYWEKAKHRTPDQMYQIITALR